MRTDKHIIQKQVFEMRGYSKRPGFEWEQSVADHHRTVIAPAIEACFDALPATGEHLVIDSIDIDLGVFTHESFAKEARDKLVSLLGEHLRECRKKAIAENEARLKEELKSSSQNIPWENTGKTARPENVFDTETAVGEALLHFLEKGELPWWFTAPEDLFNISVLSDRMIARLRQSMLREKSAMVRAVRHFSDETILELLERSGHFYATAKREWQVFSKIGKEYPDVFPRFRQRFWTERFHMEVEILPEEIVVGLFRPFSREFISRAHKICLENSSDKIFETYALFLEPVVMKEKTGLNKKNADEEKRSAQQDDREEKEGKNQPAPVKDLPEVDERAGRQETGKENKHHQSKKEEAITSSTQHTTPAAATSPAKNKTTESDEPVPSGKTGNPVLDEAVYVEAAGLVLLHPFLTELFSSTGLWKNNRWTNGGAPFKAVQLLSFLTFGAEEVPEYRLAFHKILTGLDVATPLPAEAPLLPEETATCTDLLEAVLRHWTALRNTGIDGLREGFLLRNGKLEQTPKGIKLDVERLAQDVLLARLPWGYSTVKLPWLELLLTVNWI